MNIRLSLIQVIGLVTLGLMTARGALAEVQAVHVPRPASTERLSLSQSLQVLVDPERRLGPEDVVQPAWQERFRAMTGDDSYPLSRGYFWLRVTLINASSTSEIYHLFNHFAYPDRIELYQLENDRLVLKAQRGDVIPSRPDRDNHHLPDFRLQLPPGPTTIYLLFDTLGPVNLKFSVMAEQAFTRASRTEFLWLGLLFGCLAVMVGYNIFLAIRFRSQAYYLYVGYIVCFAAVQLLFTGMAEYLLPESAVTTILVNQGIIVAAELTAMFGSLFTLTFLQIKKHSPWLYRAILAFFPLSLLDIVVPFVDFDLAHFCVLTTNTYISLVLLLAGFQCCLRRYRPAYFYLAAWSFLILGSMATMGRIYGLLPDNVFTTWSQFVGGALELILLSLALGDKLSLSQEQAHQKISRLALDLNTANAALKEHIESVESIVDAKTRDIKSMLAHIPQGIFMISAQDRLVMPEYSTHLSDILATTDIVGRSVREILLAQSDLSADQIQQTETVLLHALGECSLNFELNQGLLVKELAYKHGEVSKVLELEWSPICDARDIVEKILVTIRDVTVLRSLERQQRQQQLELEAIGKVLKIPSNRFSIFLLNCQDFLTSCLASLTAENMLEPKSINLVFMNIHTMKGMARTFFLDDLASALHDFENQLQPFLNRREALLESNKMLRFLQEVEERILFYQHIYTDKLGRKLLSKAERDKQLWIRAKVQKLRDIETGVMNAEDRETLLQVLDGLEQRYALNLEKTLEPILRSLPGTALALGKEKAQVIFERDDIMLSSEGQLLAERVFIHLFNNAIDHGIESAAERRLLGKAERGLIRISTWQENDEMLISIQDDGSGLNLRKIFQKAKEQQLFQGAMPSAKELANLIFESGFSTKDEVTITSGRGSGMDAVRTYLLNSNSSIEVELLEANRQQGDLAPIGFRFVIRLDKRLFIKPASSPAAQVA